MLAQLLLEWMDPLPLLVALVAAAPPVPPVAAVHPTALRLHPRRRQHPLQRRLLLEEGR